MTDEDLAPTQAVVERLRAERDAERKRAEAAEAEVARLTLALRALTVKLEQQ